MITRKNFNKASNFREYLIKLPYKNIAVFTHSDFVYHFTKTKDLEGIDLDSYDCNTIFVDPPRAGIDDETLKLVQSYERILYISCNPQTLKDNLQTLSATHKITRFALFDQFPYTDHMESGVLLERK